MSKAKLPKSILKKVRRFTGDSFTPARGYNLNKGLNFGQRMAVLKYSRKIDELTSRPYVEYKPKRGEKCEAFNYSGQRSYNKFDRAIIFHPAPRHKLSFNIDKSLPRGSRFTVEDHGPKDNQRPPSRYYSIPGRLLINESWPDEFDTYQDYLEWLFSVYAPGAEIGIIQNGDNYMWGSAGGPHEIAEKLSQLMNNYGSDKFDPDNRHSSYYKNWITGLLCFTSRFDAFPAIADGARKSDANKSRWYTERQKQRLISLDEWDVKYRHTASGRIAKYRNGQFVGYVNVEAALPADPKKKAKKSAYEKRKGK